MNVVKSSTFSSYEDAQNWISVHQPRAVIVDDYPGGLGQSAGGLILSLPSVYSVHVQTAIPKELFQKTGLRYLGGVFDWKDAIAIVDNNPTLLTFSGCVIIDQNKIYEDLSLSLVRDPTEEESIGEINRIIKLVDEKVSRLGATITLTPNPGL
jgi:hypothetical protein